jgi:serine/threonine protein kinase
MDRKQLYFTLNDTLSHLTNENIKKIIQVKNNLPFKKFGINKIIKCSGAKVFIKAIPVSKLYAQNQFDSSNLYKVPSYYNYGFGSAGINPWRELLLHIKTTNLVLDDTCDFFPLLYHYRVVEDDNNDNIESGLDKQLLNMWNNDTNIIKYLHDRKKSKCKIVLFLEYIPHVAWKFLGKNIDFVKSFFTQTKNIIEFLNKNGILHNDAHLGNFLIDSNKKVYLTDFGLSLSKDFNLDSKEIKFMKMNNKLDKYYIYDNVISDYGIKCLFNKKIKKKYELDKYKTTIELVEFLIDNLDIIKFNIKISNFQTEFIKKNKNKLMNFIKHKKKFKIAKNKNNFFLGA